MMELNVALELLLDRVILYSLSSIGRDLSEFSAISELAKKQSRIVFSLASNKFLPGVTESEIDIWAVEGAAHLTMRKRVKPDMNHLELSRAFRNYLMSAYLQYSRESIVI